MGQTNSYNRADNAAFADFAASNESFAGSVQNQRRFRHPVAVFFHVFFKLSAIVLYLFGSLPTLLFGQEFLGVFVTLVFLISIDFWVVKNVTGRLLVGLRWWNYIDDEGDSHWIFENRAADAASTIGASGNNDPDFVLFNQQNSGAGNNLLVGRDATVFWLGLFLSPILWFFFLISAIFSFNIHWVLFVVMALILSCSNLFGYIRCRFGANYNYKSALTEYVGSKVLFNLMRSAPTGQQATELTMQSPLTS